MFHRHLGSFLGLCLALGCGAALDTSDDSDSDDSALPDATGELTREAPEISEPEARSSTSVVTKPALYDLRLCRIDPTRCPVRPDEPEPRGGRAGVGPDPLPLLPVDPIRRDLLEPLPEFAPTE